MAKSASRTPLRGAWIEIVSVNNPIFSNGVSHPAQGCVD